MFKLAPYAAAAAAAVAVASPASAATPLTIVGDCSIACTGSFESSPVPSPTFDLEYTFSLPEISVGAGEARATVTAGSLELTEVVLYGPDSSSYAFSIDNSGVFKSATLGLTDLAAGDYVLNLIGNASEGQSLNGTISIAAVPEPATWALMLLGFGFVGFALRRREPAISKVRVRYV